MSSQHIGIEEARKVLGDLVTAAQQGTDIILTRNRRPVARITAYQEDAMSSTPTHVARIVGTSELHIHDAAEAPEFAGEPVRVIRLTARTAAAARTEAGERLVAAQYIHRPWAVVDGVATSDLVHIPTVERGTVTLHDDDVFEGFGIG